MTRIEGFSPGVSPALIPEGGAAVPYVAVEVPVTADAAGELRHGRAPVTAMLTSEQARTIARELDDAAARGEQATFTVTEHGTGTEVTVRVTDLDHQRAISHDLALHADIVDVIARAVDAYGLLRSLGDPEAAEYLIRFAFEEGLRARGVHRPPTRELVDAVRDVVLPKVGQAVSVMRAIALVRDEKTETDPAEDERLLLIGSGFMVAYAYLEGLNADIAPAD